MSSGPHGPMFLNASMFIDLHTSTASISNNAIYCYLYLLIGVESHLKLCYFIMNGNHLRFVDRLIRNDLLLVL